MSSVEAKKIVVHEPALGPGWHETIALLIEKMDPEACFQWALFDRPPMTRWSVGRVTLGSPSQNLEVGGKTHSLNPGDKLELPAFTVHSVKAPSGATYIIGMPKVDLFSEHALAPDA